MKTAINIFALSLLNTLAMAQASDETPGLPPTLGPGAELVCMFSDGRFYEGPVWDPTTGKLYFTAFAQDLKNSQIMRLDAPGAATVWMQDSKATNGMWLHYDNKRLTPVPPRHSDNSTVPASINILMQ